MAEEIERGWVAGRAGGGAKAFNRKDREEKCAKDAKNASICVANGRGAALDWSLAM